MGNTAVQEYIYLMKDIGELHREEKKVFESLEDVEPSNASPWAAEKALEALLDKKR